MDICISMKNLEEMTTAFKPVESYMFLCYNDL